MTSSFQQELGKVNPRSGNFICSKGVHDTIFEGSSAKDYSRTGDSVQDTEIVNRSGDYGSAGQKSHQKSGLSYSTPIPGFTVAKHQSFYDFMPKNAKKIWFFYAMFKKSYDSFMILQHTVMCLPICHCNLPLLHKHVSYIPLKKK